MKAVGFGAVVLASIVVFTLWPDDIQPAGIPSPIDIEIQLGDSTVVLAIHQSADSSLSMLVLHDDENTAVDAGLAVVNEDGGRLVELRAQGERRVAFSIDGRHYDLDPNRIFTDTGLRATLKPEAIEEAIVATRMFADTLVAIYDPDQVIVTLHNNTPDDYSALSYQEDGQYATDAEVVHIEEGVDPDDFFFVTDRDLFEAIRGDDFNVVLQSNDSANDDGSLSVWAARHDFLYVNVEAEHGHVEQQKAMIKRLEFLLGRLEPGRHTP